VSRPECVEVGIYPSRIQPRCGEKQPVGPSAVEDVEWVPPKCDEIVESNWSAVRSAWSRPTVACVDAAFGRVWVATVANVYVDGER